MKPITRQLIPVLVTIASIFALGTVGFTVIEGWSVLDSFYMTVITLTTIGFSETHPLSAAGRLFTVILILVGLGGVVYGLTTVGELLVSVNLITRLRKRRMTNAIAKLNDHVIVCGFGRVGWTAARALSQSRRGVVIIENDPERVLEAIAEGFLVLDGDATRDEVLRDAGVERAWGLIAATGRDGDNLLMVLSARTLNDRLFIVSRSTTPDNESKMVRAGADRVVSPYQMGGRHMANIIMRPHITEFLDGVTLETGVELWLEELIINESAELAGKTVFDVDIRRRTGVNLIAVRKGATGALTMPDERTHLDAGDELIVLGTREQLATLAGLTGPQDLHTVRSPRALARRPR